jgi:pseudaminic acid synthase
MNNMSKEIQLRNHIIGDGHPTYIIAEMSANHNQDYDIAVKIIKEIKKAGADCVKIQTYTPDTLTIDSDKEYFQISSGTWKGENLYKLYQKAYTPWEWQADLKKEAEQLGLDFLSTAYDRTSVDFLESIDLEFYKIASFELNDLPLIKYIASKQKPILLSLGMATLGEIQDAINAIKEENNPNYCLLKCSSVYPALPGDMNLKTISVLKNMFGIPVGSSDHSLGWNAAITAVALGANIIEKHFCMDRNIKNPDSTFSMEPEEFKQMVRDIREVEEIIGHVSFDISENEMKNRIFRRSIFVVNDIKPGEQFTNENVRIIRPSYGLPPKYYDFILGKKARKNIEKGNPLSWDLIE